MTTDKIIYEAKLIKFCGFYFDQNLTWEKQIKSVCSKIATYPFELRNIYLIFFSSEINFNVIESNVAINFLALFQRIMSIKNSNLISDSNLYKQC